MTYVLVRKQRNVIDVRYILDLNRSFECIAEGFTLFAYIGTQDEKAVEFLASTLIHKEYGI
jgi:hypothetical protein